MDAITASPASTMSVITVHFAGLPGLPGRGDPGAASRSCRDTTDASCQAPWLRPTTCDRFLPSAWRLILSLRLDDRSSTLREAEGNRSGYCKFPEVRLKTFGSTGYRIRNNVPFPSIIVGQPSLRPVPSLLRQSPKDDGKHSFTSHRSDTRSDMRSRTQILITGS